MSPDLYNGYNIEGGKEMRTFKIIVVATDGKEFVAAETRNRNATSALRDWERKIRERATEAGIVVRRVEAR